MKKENDKFFYNYVNDITQFWKLISNDNKKTVNYNPIEDCLFIATISKNDKVRYSRINSLKTRKHQGRLSSSQLNALRYVIHFSLIKNILKKFKRLPIQSIFIDDPDNEFRKIFFEFIEREFIESLDYQIILFTTDSDLIKKKTLQGWKSKYFERNDKIQDSNTKTFQETIMKFVNK